MATSPIKHEAFWVLVPGRRGGRRRLAGTYYVECVSSGLHSRLLMGKTQLKKKVVILKQEKTKLLDDWAQLKHHLEDMNVICNDQEEKTSDLKTQQQEVGAGK